LDSRLGILREASRRACERILGKRSDVIAVYIIGSVARGKIHEKSDVDMMVVAEQGDDFREERSEELGCNVDIVYSPLILWKEEIYHSWGSDWEVEVSSLVDSLVLYDPRGLVQKAKKDFEVYPEENRSRGIRNIHQKMRGFSESVWYHWLNRNYDVESVFSKLYAMEALRILFPLNRVYLKGDKHVFHQVEELSEKPLGYLEKCLSLLWFKSQDVNSDEAAWVINTVSETKKAIEDTIHQLRLASHLRS